MLLSVNLTVSLLTPNFKSFMKKVKSCMYLARHSKEAELHVGSGKKAKTISKLHLFRKQLLALLSWELKKITLKTHIYGLQEG